MVSRSHRSRAVRPAESPEESLRATHDAWTRDLREWLPNDDSDPSDGDTPPRMRAPRHRSPTRAADARREPTVATAPRQRSPTRAVPDARREPPVATGGLERQIAGLTAAVHMLMEQQTVQLHDQRTLRADMKQMLERQQSVAVGEVVQEARESWHGEANDGTLPRLPKDITYKDGLLTWTAENVGELLACIAYKHLITVKDEADNEGAGANASEIKQAAMAQGVDGRALLHLTIDDMEKIGETAGTVEGGGECALT